MVQPHLAHRSDPVGRVVPRRLFRLPFPAALPVLPVRFPRATRSRPAVRAVQLHPSLRSFLADPWDLEVLPHLPGRVVPPDLEHLPRLSPRGVPASPASPASHRWQRSRRAGPNDAFRSMAWPDGDRVRLSRATVLIEPTVEFALRHFSDEVGCPNTEVTERGRSYRGSISVLPKIPETLQQLPNVLVPSARV
jgi:hypothetical protein